MSDFDQMRDAMGIEPLVKRDPREAFAELEGFEHPKVNVEVGLTCIVCESGYHGQDWEIVHVMKCGCPCHGKQAVAIGA